jgi:hypothetical protein
VKRRNYLEDPGKGGRILLKMDVKKIWRVLTGLTG